VTGRAAPVVAGADGLGVTRGLEGAGGLVLVTGGARSGKSRYALDRAGAVVAAARAGAAAGADPCTADRVVFVATAEALDAEMADRIGRHRAERDRAWHTVEAPRALEAAVAEARAAPDTAVVVVDCLSLWVSNLMLDGVSETEIVGRAAVLVAPTSGGATDRPVVVVTNEVGLGIVPDNALARAYRDVLGRVNQTVAAAATEVHLMVAGLPLRIR
jgi:adenosylcobinamide kinase/adenosylcobinamide-phosphate guanylyltransferase